MWMKILRIAALLMIGPWRPILAQDVSGQVHDPRGEPLAGVTVELEVLLPAHQLAVQQLEARLRAYEFAPNVATAGRSDRDGGFHLTAPRPGFWRIVVRHPEYLPASFDLSPLLADRRLPDLTLQRRSELVTRWIDEDGEPVSDLRFTARGWSAAWRESSRQGWWPADRSARTRDDGVAAVPCESGEKVSIAVVTHDRFLFQVADCHAGLVELQLANKLRTARVVDADGKPAESVYGFIRWPFVSFGVTAEDGGVVGPFDWQETVPIVFADTRAFYGEPRPLHPGPVDVDPVDVDSLDEMASTTGLPPTELPTPDRPVAEVLTFELPATFEVSGQVVDRTDDRAINDAFLWVGRGAHFFQTLEGGGHYELRLPVGSEASLGFGASGYIPMNYRLSRPGEWVARLVPSLSVAGRVVDVTGEGIGGAKISSVRAHQVFSALDSPGGNLILAQIDETTAEDGSFELRGLAPERSLKLEVARLGYAVHHEVLSPRAIGGGSPEFVITLERGYDGFGWVVNENDLPIAGAEVSLLPALTGSASDQDFAVEKNFGATTDAEGFFQLHDLPIGTYYLAAKSQGFPEHLVPGIEIVAGAEPVDLGTVTLVHGILLSGRVVDPEGEPVAGAQLSMRNADGEQIVVQRAGSPWFAAVTSRQNGSFHLDGLPSARRLVMVVSADGYLPRTLPVTTGEEDQQLTVELSSGARVVGIVLEPSGSPASGARVQAQATQGLRRLDATSKDTQADQAGRFEIGGLRPGDYELTARSKDARSEVLRRELRGSVGTEVVIQLEPRSTIDVILTDLEGVPVAGAGLTALIESGTRSGRRGTYARSDQAGLAVLGPLDPGKYIIKATHGDFEAIEAEVEVLAPGSLPLALAFEQRRDLTTFRLSGRVVDEAGLPVKGARLSIIGARPGHAVTGSDGSFEITAPADEYRLSCQHAEYPTYRSGPIDLTAGDVSDLLVELAPGAAVVGRVTGVSTEEFAQVVVVARGPISGEGGLPLSFGQHYGSINFEGEFRVPGLQAGEWQIRAELLNPKRAASERVEIPAGANEIRADLHFDGGYRLTGGVFDGGEPTAGVVVVMTCSGEFRAEVSTDSEGRFTIDNIPAEACVVRARDPDSGVEARQEIEMTFDSEVVLDFR